MGPEPDGQSEAEQSLEYVSYGEFGEEFFARAVTSERVLAAVSLLAEHPIRIGPSSVGPGGLVRFSARGAVGEAVSEPLEGHEVGYRVTLPVTLHLQIDLALESQRFDAELWVPLELRARAAAGLKMFLDVTPPAHRDIRIDLQAQGMRASLVQRVAGLEGEVRRFVAGYVASEIAKPYVRKACTIDVGNAIDVAWERIAPRGRSETAAHITEDFEDAADAELQAKSGGLR